MNTVFWGTPQTAVPFLEKLNELARVSAVITQPDSTVGRGMVTQAPAVKIAALRLGIPVLQPNSLKDPSVIESIRPLKPDLGIVVAYGKLIPRPIIDLFPKGLFNVHFSLLPKFRGAAPMQRAILEGAQETGVTIFQITEALDAGDVLVKKSIPLSESDDAETLEQKLIALGLEALEETVKLVQSGSAKLDPQRGEPTFAPLLSKEDARIDWNRPAIEIGRQVRGLVRMGAFTRTPEGTLLKILACEPLSASAEAGVPPGTILRFERRRGFVVKCGEDAILVLRVQPEGRKPGDAWSYLQGARLKEGSRLGS